MYMILEAYYKSKIAADQCYQQSKKKIAKPAKIWSERKLAKQPLQPKEWTITPTNVKHVARTEDATPGFTFRSGLCSKGHEVNTKANPPSFVFEAC